MDLYVCKDRVEEYASGMIIVAANSLKQAIEVIQTSSSHQPDWNYAWDLNAVRLMEGSTTSIEPHIVEQVYRGE